MKLNVLSASVLAWMLAASPLNLAADNLEKHMTRGHAEFDQNLFTDAADEFRQAQRLKPDSLEPRVWLGLALLKLGDGDYARGDLNKAIAEYREALRLEPDEAYWHQALAQVLEKNGDRQGAEAEYRAASELSPDDSGLRSAFERFEGAGGVEPPENAQAVEPEDMTNYKALPGNVKPPTELFAPTPDYSEKARKAKYQGGLVLTLVVGKDGTISDTRVVKPLGMGLDQMALAKVRRWKFKPATRDGVPVAARVKLEVTFRIH